MVIFYYYTCVV